MIVHKFISVIISKLKNETYILDETIPIGYILTLLIKKIICLINGIIVFGKPSFVALGTVIKCRRKIKAGRNLSIDKSCHIDALSEDGVHMGNNVSIGKYTVIECSGSMKSIGKGLIVGDNVGFGTHGFWGCAGGVQIGSDVIFGNFVSLHSENHNFKDLYTPIRLQGVSRQGIRIGNNCWIGAKVTILDGSVIGNGCVVAAGAVVRGEFPDNVVIGGVPARILKYRE